MSRLPLLPLLIVLATQPYAALAHGYIKEWTVNNVTALAQKQALPDTAFRSCPDNTGFVGSDYITNVAVTCSSSVTPFNITSPPSGLVFSDPSQAAGITMNTPAGKNVQLVISGNPGVGWPHPNGHVQTYLGLCGSGPTDCQTFDATKANWFKIQSELNGIPNSLIPAYDATVDGNRWNIPLPETLPTGSYMLRYELLAFDQTNTNEGSQVELYPFCGQLYITGASSATLTNVTTVQFPAAYTGVTLNESTVPGPPLAVFASSTSPSPTSTSKSGSKKLGLGAIVGIAVGGAALALAILLLTWFLRRRSSKRRKQPTPNQLSEIEKSRPIPLPPSQVSEFNHTSSPPHYSYIPTGTPMEDSHLPLSVPVNEAYGERNRSWSSVMGTPTVPERPWSTSTATSGQDSVQHRSRQDLWDDEGGLQAPLSPVSETGSGIQRRGE